MELCHQHNDSENNMKVRRRYRYHFSENLKNEKFLLDQGYPKRKLRKQPFLETVDHDEPW